MIAPSLNKKWLPSMPIKPAEYRLRPKAKEDMEALWRFSLSRWGIDQTNRYIDEITSAFELLANSPKVGVVCENIRERYRKHPVFRHVIYYREAGFGIDIVRVLHDRMLASSHLKMTFISKQ